MVGRISRAATGVVAILVSSAIGCGAWPLTQTSTPTACDGVASIYQGQTTDFISYYDVYTFRADEPQVLPVCTSCIATGLSPDRRWLMTSDPHGVSSVVSSEGGRRSSVGSVLQFEWSSDGKTLAYATNEGAFVADADGGNATAVLPAASFGGVTWSPNHQHVAFTVPQGVVVTDARGGTPVTLQTASGSVLWAPNSQRLAVYTLASVELADWDGANPVKLTEGRDYASAYGWSPDGAWFAFTSDQTATGPTVVRADGSGSVSLGGAAIPGEVAWSPTEPKLAFGSGAPGAATVTIWSPEGATTISVDPPADTIPFLYWSADGSKILFTVGGTAGYSAVIDARDGHELTRTVGPGPQMTWSPDGSQLLFVDSRTNGDGVWVTDVTGSNRVQVVSTPGGGAWLPDSRHVATMTARALSVASTVGSSPPVDLLSSTGAYLDQDYVMDYRDLQR